MSHLGRQNHSKWAKTYSSTSRIWQNQAAGKTAIAVMMALRYVEAGSKLTTAVNYIESQRQRHSRPVLENMAFNWGTQDMYIELINFEMEVSNILEAKVYELPEEEEASVM